MQYGSTSYSLVPNNSTGPNKCTGWKNRGIAKKHTGRNNGTGWKFCHFPKMHTGRNNSRGGKTDFTFSFLCVFIHND